MTEMLFLLTVIFVAYVVYVAVNEHKTTPKSTVPKAKPEEAPEKVAEQPMTVNIVEDVKPTVVKTKTINKTISPTVTQQAVKKGLRDPKTGEVATAYNNYRFTKRWIKDALVTEKLVEKVYKNSELDTAIEAKIKDALVKLEALDKYKP
jgi:hypothetical protein